MRQFQGQFAIGASNIRYDLMEVINPDLIKSDMFTAAADLIAPVVIVPRRTGNIPKLVAGQGEKDVEGRRNIRGSYPRITWGMTDTSYTTEARGWEIPIDEIEDYDTREFVNLEEYNSTLLVEMMYIGKEKRVIDDAQLATNYTEGTNMKTITLAAQNWLTGTKMFDDITTVVAPYFYGVAGIELEQISLGLGIQFIRKIANKLADLNDSVAYTTPVEKMTFNEKASLVRQYLGVREIIPLSGRVNSTHIKSLSVAFTRLWTQTNAIAFYRSSGGGWDESYARQPMYTRPIGGNEYIIDTYDEPTNGISVQRLIHIPGNKFNFTLGYLVRGLEATGT